MWRSIYIKFLVILLISCLLCGCGKQEHIENENEEINENTYEPYDNTEKAKATTYLNIRENASTESDILYTLSANDEFEIIEDDNEWYKIKYDKYTGYVSKQYVSINDEAESRTINENEEEINVKNSPPQNLIEGDEIQKQLLEKINEYRKENDLQEIYLTKEITDAANIRIEEIKEKMSHQRPNGEKYSSLLKNYEYASENIACGTLDADTALKAWLTSPKNKQALTDPGFQYCGIGYDSENKNIVVILISGQ